MEYQIRYPDGFARMLEMIIKTDQLPELTFWKKGSDKCIVVEINVDLLQMMKGMQGISKVK